MAATTLEPYPTPARLGWTWSTECERYVTHFFSGIFTFFQAPAAPTLSFWPSPSSSSISGIPTSTSITRKGSTNAPGEYEDLIVRSFIVSLVL